MPRFFSGFFVLAAILAVFGSCSARTPQPSSLDQTGNQSAGPVTEFPAGSLVPGNFTLTDQSGKPTQLALVTTDPKRDTPAVLEAYTKEVEMDGAWEFLTGSLAQVQPVWILGGDGSLRATLQAEVAPIDIKNEVLKLLQS